MAAGLPPAIYALWAALAGMLTGSGLVLLVGEVGSRVFRKPAMGFGDVKLMGFLGAFTRLDRGDRGLLPGLRLRVGGRHIPAGSPRLAVPRVRSLPGPGCLVIVLWPEAFERLASWYMGLLGG